MCCNLLWTIALIDQLFDLLQFGEFGIQFCDSALQLLDLILEYKFHSYIEVTFLGSPLNDITLILLDEFEVLGFEHAHLLCEFNDFGIILNGTLQLFDLISESDNLAMTILYVLLIFLDLRQQFLFLVWEIYCTFDIVKLMNRKEFEFMLKPYKIDHLRSQFTKLEHHSSRIENQSI